MSASRLNKTITSIYDAVLDERNWTTALQAIAEYVGAVDVGYLVTDRKTGLGTTVAWWGAFADLATDYMVHYGNIDPFRRVQESADRRSWIRATEALPATLLSKDEWYNDFILKNGIRDVLNCKLYESRSHVALIGFQKAKDDRYTFPRIPTTLRRIDAALRQAAHLHITLRELGHQSAIGQEVLSHLAAGIIFVTPDAKVAEANPIGEQILSLGDGLTVRNGRLRARRNFESAKLKALIADATALPPSAGCTLIARQSTDNHYVVRVAPVGIAIGIFNRPMAMVWVTKLQDQSAPGRDLVALFGLSPAQNRVALGIAAGKTPIEISKEFGIKITTVRSHLAAIFRKLDVNSQSGIIRIFSATLDSGTPTKL